MPIGVAAQSIFAGQGIFARKYLYEKLTKMPEFYTIFAPEIFFRLLCLCSVGVGLPNLVKTKDILNHDRVITSGRNSVRWFCFEL